MVDNITLKELRNIDFDWATLNECSIKQNDNVVGEITFWTFNKSSILENMEDDYAFYMDEDTHMHERTAEFILDNIENKNCVYIDSVLINKEHRRRGIGSKAIEIIKDKYKESFIVLFASALDKEDKEHHILGDEKEFNKLLSNLNSFYKKLGFKNKDNIYYIK